MPKEKTVSGVRIGLVLGGIGIALPAILSGIEVGRALGFTESAYAFLLAAIAVTVMGAFSALVGAKARLSTYMLIQFSFGPMGSKLVNFSFGLTQIGWFTVNIYIFGSSAVEVGDQVLGLELGQNAYIILGGFLMTASTIFGFKALDKLALFAVPLLITTLVYMIAATFNLVSLDELIAIPGTGTMSLATASTALVGGIMVGVVLLPDLTRYARSPRDAIIAILIALAIMEPLVHLAGAMPGIATGEDLVLNILIAVGLGLFAGLILIFTSWTTNAVNLYGAGLSMSAVFPKFGEWKIIALGGIAGTAVALWDVSDLFIDFLVYQSIIFAPVVGIYVLDFFVIKRRRYDLADLSRSPAIGWQAFAAWTGGSAITYSGEQEILNLSGIPSLDGALVAALLYFLLMKLIPLKPAEQV